MCDRRLLLEAALAESQNPQGSMVPGSACFDVLRLVRRLTLASEQDAGALLMTSSARSRRRGRVSLTTVAGVPPAPPTEERTSSSASVSTSSRWFQPGWPLAWLFVGYPLWWVLGIEEFVTIGLTIPMALALRRQRSITMPPAFLAWGLFLVWVAGGLLVLQVDAPGAIPGNSNARYLTWAYRLVWYLACTVVLLYIGNTKEKLSATRICRILGFMFVVVTVGGLAGSFLPNLDFPSALELVLPKGVVNSTFVYNLIHPNISEIQSVLGHEAPRPSAPFTYANIWGLNYAVLLPFFLRGWFGRDAGWRRFVGPVIVALSVIPVIYSLNRGLWLALIGMALFTAIRSALVGRPAQLLLVLAGAVAIVVAISVTPLGTIVQQRLNGENSNQGRTNLSSLAVQSVVQKSPVAGYGTTRYVQGNFNTIAGGATALCPHCDPPAIGTQGQLWFVVYGQGVVGLLLFLAFFVTNLSGGVRSRSPSASVGLGVLVAAFITMPVYNSLGLALFEIMIGIGLLWRERTDLVSRTITLPSLSRPVARRAFLQRPLPVVSCCAIIGMLGGGLWQAHAGTPTQATITVHLPQESTTISVDQGPVTIDTLAQLVTSGRVQAAIRARDAGSMMPLEVRALPNTMILNLAYTTDRAKNAAPACRAAVTAYLDELKRLFAKRRAVEVASLRSQAAAAEAALTHVELLQSQLIGAPVGVRSLTKSALLQIKHKRLARSFRAAERHLVSVQVSAIARAQIVQPVQASRQPDYWNVSLTSGLLLGILLGAVVVVGATNRKPVGLAHGALTSAAAH